MMDIPKMASVNSVRANEGINVENKNNDPEISAMGLKMNENNVLDAAKQLASALVEATAENFPQKNNQEKLPKDIDDIKDQFSWKNIAGFCIPYIIRLVDGKHLKFVSTRMGEHLLLKKYLCNLNADIYRSCTYVRGFVITDLEAKILNYINDKHYGKDFKFLAGKDYIIRLEDFHNFYTFIEVCYTKLLCNNTSGHKDKCGFICISSESIIPYCTIDGQKFVPTFFFEGDTEYLEPINILLELDNWNLAYLKFCCKLLGVKAKWFDSESWLVVDIDHIKRLYPPEATFEDFWPPNLSNLFLFAYRNSKYENPPGLWFKAPLDVVTDKNTIHHNLTAPSPVVPQSTEVMNHMPPQQKEQQQMQQQHQPILTTPEVQAHKNSDIAAYKVHLAIIEGKIIFCINTKPHIYSEFVVTLKDVVRIWLPSCTVAKCAHVLYKYLKTTLFFGELELLAVLLGKGLVWSMIPGDTPMVIVQDIKKVLPQLKKLVTMQDDEIEKII